MAPAPMNKFEYLMVKGEGNKGVSYKYTWKPDWRNPPGVKQSRVFAQLLVVLGIAAVPIYVLPLLRGETEQTHKREESVYVAMKNKMKQERNKWIQSDDMPYK